MTSLLAFVLLLTCPCGGSCPCGDAPPRFVLMGTEGLLDASRVLSAHPSPADPTLAQVLFRGGGEDLISGVTREQWAALRAALILPGEPVKPPIAEPPAEKPPTVPTPETPPTPPPSAPTVSITAPQPGAKIQGTSVEVRATLGGNVAQVMHWHLQLDGGTAITLDPGTTSYSFTGVPAGDHLVAAWLSDLAHKDVPGSRVEVKFSTTIPPPPPIDPPPPGPQTPVASVTVTLESATLAIGATTHALATAKDAAGNLLSGRSVTWTTSDPKVATVASDGTVTAVKQGDATITATVEGKSGIGVLLVKKDEAGHDHGPPVPGQAHQVTPVQSGPWSVASTWGTGGPPVADDSVTVPAGVTVLYDLARSPELAEVTVAAGGTLRWAADRDTLLSVGTIWVTSGTLEIGTPEAPIPVGVTAEVVFADRAIDTAIDPDQKGGGLYASGTAHVRICGAPKTPFVRLAAEVAAGATTLALAESVSGWRPGDRLVVPGSRTWDHPWSELREIRSVSGDGRTVTPGVPIEWVHPGARDGDGKLDFLPHVGNLTRNVVLRSANPAGTRGHTLYTERADVDIRHAEFRDLGRTRLEVIDSTTFGPDGKPTHLGTNQIGRYAWHAHHLLPPARADGGPLFRIVGCSINNQAADAAGIQLGAYPAVNIKWGIAVHASHYGMVADNVIYNTAGGGLVTEDGDETGNVLEHNFIVRVRGTDGDPRELPGGRSHAGTGLYLAGLANIVRDNVVADTISDAFTFACFGESAVRTPTAPGQSPSSYVAVDMHAFAIREFSGNEGYGSKLGLTVWNIGVSDPSERSVVKDLHLWHIGQTFIYFYPSNRVRLDGLVMRGDGTPAVGIINGHYFVPGMEVVNSDIQGLSVGINFPTTLNDAPLIVENTILRNVVNIVVPGLELHWGSTQTQTHPRTIIIRNCRFGNPSFGERQWDILMGYRYANNSSDVPLDVVSRDEVFVYDTNGVAGDDFQVYYEEQAANFVVPATGGYINLGAPEPGLTNAQAWKKYQRDPDGTIRLRVDPDAPGIAIAGAVAPADTVQRPKIKGLVVPLRKAG